MLRHVISPSLTVHCLKSLVLSLGLEMWSLGAVLGHSSFGLETLSLESKSILLRCCCCCHNTMSTKSNPNVFFAVILKTVNKFPSNAASSYSSECWTVCVKLSTSPDMCTHTTVLCYETQNKLVIKQCTFT